MSQTNFTASGSEVCSLNTDGTQTSYILNVPTPYKQLVINYFNDNYDEPTNFPVITWASHPSFFPTSVPTSYCYGWDFGVENGTYTGLPLAYYSPLYNEYKPFQSGTIIVNTMIRPQLNYSSQFVAIPLNYSLSCNNSMYWSSYPNSEGPFWCTLDPSTVGNYMGGFYIQIKMSDDATIDANLNFQIYTIN